MSIHQLAHRLHARGALPLARLCDSIIFALFNSSIPATASIGTGTIFAYRGIGVVMHTAAVVGENCVLGQGITIGSKEGFVTDLRPTACPRIGDNVYIAAGARVLGDISVGSSSIIAANSVVLSDVATGSIVAGCPARVVGRTPEGYRAIQR